MTFARELRSFGVVLSRCAPYMLLELLMPGGTLCALLLFLYQRRRQFKPARLASASGRVRVMPCARLQG